MIVGARLRACGWLFCLLVLPMSGLANPGSWSAQAEPLRAAVAGRSYQTRPLAAADAAPVRARAVTTVYWQYRLQGDGPALVELCSGQRCEQVNGRGRSEAFAGQPADAAFHFRVTPASATRGASAAVQLVDARLIVNHD